MPRPRHRTPDTPAARVLLTVLSALVVLLLVGGTALVLRDPDTPADAPTTTAAAAAAAAAASTAASDRLPAELTVRVLADPLVSPSKFDRARRGRTFTSTAVVFAAPPGQPLPTPTTDTATDTPATAARRSATVPRSDTARGLTPAGQAALTCTKVARTGVQLLCEGSALLPDGQLTFSGATLRQDALVPPGDVDITLTITGGSGVYAHAAGSLVITANTRISQDWMFRFTPH